MADLSTDFLDVAMDEDGDILLDEDGLHFVAGLEGVAQLCLIAVTMYREEWPYDLDEGTPWHQEILGQKFSEPLLRARLLERLLKVPNVIEVPLLLINFNPKIRKATVTWVARTTFGNTEPFTATVGGV